MNQVKFTVEGRRPFPLDMLRYDQAVPDTPEDQAKIDRFSQEHAPDKTSLRERTTIHLRMPRRSRHDQPTAARWASFGWRVTSIDGEPQARPEPEKGIKLEPTWTAAMRIYITALKYGTEAGQEAAEKDLMDLAAKLDRMNAGGRP